MRNLKFTRLICLTFGVILISMIISSCGDDNEIPTDYAGKWVTEKPIPVATGYTSVKYYLELTQSDFKETFVRPARTSYTTSDQLSIEGSVSVTGKIMKLVIHKISISIYNSSTSTASEPHETYTFKDQDFGLEFEGIGSSTSNHQVEYNLVDGQLILKIDYDMDGIYSENQKSVYTKQ
jgi:hypothetical protein